MEVEQRNDQDRNWGKGQFGSKVGHEQKIHAVGSGYYMKGEDTSRTAQPRTVGESDSLPLGVEFPEYRVAMRPREGRSDG
jgi:hypothetical protein